MRYVFTILMLAVLAIPFESRSQCTCDAGVTTFTVDLSSTTDSVWTASSSRSGKCCGATGSEQCIRFLVSLNPQTDELAFNVANPSPPGGAFYQVDCGTPTSLGTPLCVSGDTSFCITFCNCNDESNK